MGRVSERNLGLPSGHDGSVKYQVFHANFLMQYIGKLIYDGQCSTERAMNRDDLLLPHAAHWLDRGDGSHAVAGTACRVEADCRTVNIQFQNAGHQCAQLGWDAPG